MFQNSTTGVLQIYVTSDLWTPASGTATFAWYNWQGTPLNISTPASATVNVGAINTTLVLETNTFDVLNAMGYDYADVLLKVETEVRGSLPNGNETRSFRHENWWHAAPLSAAKLVDPGLVIEYDDATGNFTVMATTGVASWVWIDSGEAVVNFDSNGFWLLPGQSREVGFKVKNDGTGGKWIGDVTVESLWNNTLS